MCPAPQARGFLLAFALTSTLRLTPAPTSQASGSFFRSLPMSQYGSTPLAYMCVFGLKRVLLQLAGDSAFAPFFDLNERAHACRATGYLPLHAVVANSRDFGLQMFDFLTWKLPPRMRANPDAKTPEDHLFGRLTPLTLAVKLGDCRAAEFILKRRMKVAVLGAAAVRARGCNPIPCPYTPYSSLSSA